MQVERVDFVAMPVTDLARADDFYGETLGLARNPNSSGERWVEYEAGNVTLALSMYGGTLALRVPDVAEARRELEGAGVEFAQDTFDSGVCHGAPFTDADGNHLLLHRRYAPLDAWDPPATEVGRADFAMQPSVGPLHARGTLIHRTATLAFTEARIYDEQERVCAHATGTFKYVKRRLPTGPASANEMRPPSTD